MKIQCTNILVHTSLIFLTFSFFSKSEIRHRTHRVRSLRSEGKTSVVGDSEILDCDLFVPPGASPDSIFILWKRNIKGESPFYTQRGSEKLVTEQFRGRVHLYEGGPSIQITNIKEEDEGWYECRVLDVYKRYNLNSNGSWIYLTVHAPPVIGNNSPSFLLGKKGQNIELWCSATGSPEPQLTWLKDGNEVLSSEDIIVDGNKIRLNNLKREDGGAYQCVFKNVVGQASHTIKLIIKGYVYIMKKPRNITVQDGNEAKFICHADNEFHNSTFKWYKDNVDVQLVPGLGDLRSSILSDGTLIIRNVIKSDSAWFECEAKNGISTSAKAKAFLNVTYLPVVLTSDMTVLLPRNMPGLLSCPFDANPPVTTVVWTKNEQEIKFLDETRVYKRNLSDLAFRTVRESDEGAYSCTPYSALGASKYSPRFQVHIRDPPYFKERPKRYFQKQVGDTISIPCEATGDPTPTIKWRKQNGQLDPEKKLIEDGRLVITYLSMDDGGYYECEASNEVATIVTTTLLIVEVSSPHRARNISIKTTENTANVKWLPAFDSDYAKRQDYFIWYRVIEKNTKQNWTTIAVPDDYTSLLVENLKSDTPYEFVILSRNSLGNGLFSERHFVKTKGSKRHITEPEIHPPAAITNPPSGPRPDSPRNLTIKNLGDTLEIHWLPPRNLTVPVQYYIVYFRTVGKFDDLSGPINNGTSFEWKGFSRGAKYRFKVFSYNNGAQSKPSEEMVYHTGDPMKKGVKLSKAAIGGIVGGLLFFVFTVIMSVCGVKIFSRNHDKRESVVKYGNVKYFGPSNPNNIENRNGSKSGVPITGNQEPVEEKMLDQSQFNHVLYSHNRMPIIPPSEQTSECDHLTYDHVSSFSGYITPLTPIDRSRDSLKGSVKETPI